jgi:hypothetical protein
MKSKVDINRLKGYKLFDYVSATVVALLSWNFSQTPPNMLTFLSNQNSVCEVIKLFKHYIKILKSRPRDSVAVCILAVFGVKYPDSEYMYFLNGQLICERGRIVISRYL